jgi:hypothetical protein
VGAQDYSLAAWRQLGYDSNSVAADPQFVDATDLHILPVNSLLDSAGLLTAVIDDIDGEPRSDPPDIGADEFSLSILPDAPEELTISVAGSDIILSWLPVAAADHYLIYSSPMPDFDPDEDTFLGVTTDTMFTDTLSADNFPAQFYKVIAESGE